MLRVLNIKLGDPTEHLLDSWREDDGAFVGSDQSGTRMTLRYRVTHTKHSSVETFVLEKQPGNAGWKILSLDIQSDALLSE